jgi:hypothetical protein
MNSPNPLSGPDPKHGRAVEADIDDDALVASGPQPKHGAVAALSAGAVGAAGESAVETDAGPEGMDV